MKRLFILSLMLLLTGCQQTEMPPLTEPVTNDATEKFVRDHLMNEKGWLQTNSTTRKNEYLSESLGLWMLLLVEYEDQKTFQAVVNTLPEWLTPEKLVYWQKIDGKNSAANAWIDDFRIAYALKKASDKWPSSTYLELSENLIKQLIDHHYINDTFIDFYDINSRSGGNVQTVSYYNEWGMKEMLPKNMYQSFYLHRSNEEKDGSIFPPTRYIAGKGYEFDKEVNLIDILYTLLYRPSWGEVEKASYHYLVSTYEETGRLPGRVDRHTAAPAVTYESPAVYALFGLVAWQQEDEKLAQSVLEKLQQKRVQKGANEGAFTDSISGDLHVFDHLLYLLLERKVSNGSVE